MHADMLRYHDVVLKPVEEGSRGRRELRFYQRLFGHEGHASQEDSHNPHLLELRDLVPFFHGTMSLLHEGRMSNILFRQQQQQWLFSIYFSMIRLCFGVDSLTRTPFLFYPF